MKKKILYVITKSNWGGAQRYVFDLATAMKNEGYDVAVALGGGGILKQKLDSNGIRTISISKLGRDMSLSKDAGSFKQIYSIIKNEQPDVLHLNSPKAAGLGALVGRLLGIKKIVYTVHGWTFNEERPLWQKTLIKIASWFTVLFCHKVIFLSQKEYHQSLRFPLVKNKLHVVSLGIQPVSFLLRDEARKILGLPADASVVGTIAELHKNKGLTHLIEAATQLPKQTFYVIGEGGERKNLESLIEEKGLGQRFVLSGYRENASEYLKAFDIFALPSLKEGLPYVLLEAGLASLPVIATNVGGVREVIENGKTGIVIEPKELSVLVQSIKTLTENREKVLAFGTELYKKINSNFSSEKMVSETEKLYRGKL